MAKYYINCPYSDKDEAKALGARWDAEQKKWYFTDKSKEKVFAKWLPKSTGNVKSPASKKTTAEELGESDFYRRYINPFGTRTGIMEVVGRTFVDRNFPPIAYSRIKIKDFVILDTETTGLEEDDEIIELSILDSVGKELYHCMFKPEKRIHWQASKLTGITNKVLDKSFMAQRFWNEWENIKRSVGGKRIIAHNVEFDYRLMEQTADRYGVDTCEIDNLFEGCIDSIDIAKAHVISPNYKLLTLCSVLGIQETQRHRASDDCLMILEMLRKIETLPEDDSRLKKGTTKYYGNMKPSTYKGDYDVLELYYRGRSFKEIAKTLDMDIRSVEYYIERLVCDEQIEFRDFVSYEKEREILETINSISKWDGKLKPVKDRVSKDISYFEIRLTIAYLNLDDENIIYREPENTKEPPVYNPVQVQNYRPSYQEKPKEDKSMGFGKSLTDEELNRVLREEARRNDTTYVPIEQLRENSAKKTAANKPKTKWQELTEETMINKLMDLHLHWFLFYPLIFWYLTKNEMHHAIRLHNWTLTEGAFMSGFKYVLIFAGILFGLMLVVTFGAVIGGIIEGIKRKCTFKQILFACGYGLSHSWTSYIPALKYPAWYVVAFAFLKYAVLPIYDWQAQNPDALKILFWVGMVLIVIHVLIAVILKVREMKKDE